MIINWGYSTVVGTFTVAFGVSFTQDYCLAMARRATTPKSSTAEVNHNSIASAVQCNYVSLSQVAMRLENKTGADRQMYIAIGF